MNDITVLVVDDESRMRKLIRDFLAQKGYSILEAQDGEEALKVFEENKNKISKQFEEKIQDNIKVAVKVFNENDKNINKWKEAFNNKNFMKMEKIYKEIEKNKVNTVSIEENIKELKKIENMHLLIKRKGGDFNLTNEELELVEKLT